MLFTKKIDSEQKRPSKNSSGTSWLELGFIAKNRVFFRAFFTPGNRLQGLNVAFFVINKMADFQFFWNFYPQNFKNHFLSVHVLNQSWRSKRNFNKKIQKIFSKWVISEKVTADTRCWKLTFLYIQPSHDKLGVAQWDAWSVRCDPHNEMTKLFRFRNSHNPGPKFLF